MDSEESNSDPDAEEEESEESEGVVGLALATALVSKSISTEESTTQGIRDEAEDTTPAFCFMAKSSKVSSHSSCDDASDDEPNKTYAKLAKLASRQQRALDKVKTH